MAKRTLTLLTVLLASVFLLCSCRTVSEADHNQITKAAIDLADAQVSLGRYSDALETYQKARDIIQDYRLDYNCAMVLSLLGRNSEASDLCADSFSIYPHILSLKKAQAVYLWLDGKHSAAFEAYLEVLTLNPYDRDTRFELIDRYLQDKQTSKAYDQALIMWKQGYMDKKTVDVLYALEPEPWQNVHNQLSR